MASSAFNVKNFPVHRFFCKTDTFFLTFFVDFIIYWLPFPPSTAFRNKT